MSAKASQKQRARQRAAAKRAKKPSRAKRSLSAKLTPREMTLEELQEAIGPTAAQVAAKTGQAESVVRAALTAMVETGVVGIADDGTVAPLKPLPKE